MDRFICRSKLSIRREPPGAAPSKSGGRSETGPPLKRPKIEEFSSRDEDDESPQSVGDEDDGEGFRSLHGLDLSRQGSHTSDIEHTADDNHSISEHEMETTIESSLPPVKSGRGAIDEYAALRASQLAEEIPPSEIAGNEKPQQWARGKSSIYVDAFNLALDTVLEDESHLFDENERAVFEAWKSLGYEAQYLYVRLFLRKTASWHRIERLGYHSDISEIDLAIRTLLNRRILPHSGSEGSPVENETLQATQGWSLGDSFSFADDSEVSITDVGEAVSLLGLDELKALAKEAKVQGRSKADISKALCRMSSQQAGLMAFGLRRQVTTAPEKSQGLTRKGAGNVAEHQDSNRNTHFLVKILAITGPLIRLSEPVFKLFERVHLVFYRSTEWTEKSLTAIILAKISRRNFPEYIVCRSCNIFTSRQHLLEFEHSMRIQSEVDKILEFNGPPGEEGFRRVADIFEGISARWRQMLAEEQRKEDNVYEFGEGAYLRRFNPGHAYTRVAHKAAHIYGRLHEYGKEHALLSELLAQRLFHPARRGYWYQRKALLEENYMWEADPQPPATDPERQKRHWRGIAAATCEAALEDRDCHLIYHYDLQKRLVKLERRLRIPKRLQHDFGHVRLRQPEEHTVTGVQLKRDDASSLLGKPKPGAAGGPSTRTIWVDELGDGASEVSVEEMCLSWYRSQGWKGYHSEGGILRTLFAYLLYDVLFQYVPNVFQTAYQTCPLDLHTDAFYPARASEINQRLVEIANGAGERIIRAVDEKERSRRTSVVGLNWDFEADDLAELVRCFDGGALAAVCRVMAQEYRARGGGVPDLVLWRPARRGCDGGEEEGEDGNRSGTGEALEGVGEVMFVEVKSANDRLSDTQRLWIHVLTGAGVRVALCNAVAGEVRSVD